MKDKHRQLHCALIVEKTYSGKTKWILDLLETEYKNTFKAIVIICPTLFKNKTYLSRLWMYMDDNVYLCDLDRERLSLNLASDLYRDVLDGVKNLFIVHDYSSTQEIKYRKKRAR